MRGRSSGGGSQAENGPGPLISAAGGALAVLAALLVPRSVENEPAPIAEPAAVPSG
jgi:hypothetical protein